MSFVSPVLQCRAANQLTQIIAAFALARKRGLELRVPDHAVLRSPAYYWADYFERVPVSSRNTLLEGHADHPLANGGSVARYRELQPPPQFIAEGFLLCGFFQSPRYFNEYRRDILRRLDFPQAMNVQDVAIHDRLGDYLSTPNFSPVTLDYLRRSIAYYLERGFRRFRLFSDSPTLAIARLQQLGLSFDVTLATSNGSEDPVAAFIEMQNCGHHITAVSSFSWLAHWFCQNPEKSCTVPRERFWHSNLDLYADYSPQLVEIASTSL